MASFGDFVTYLPFIRTKKTNIGAVEKMRLLCRYATTQEIDGFCSGKIEIATVAALLRNDIRGLFSFQPILRIISGARNDKKSTFASLRAIQGIARQSQALQWNFFKSPILTTIPIVTRMLYNLQTSYDMTEEFPRMNSTYFRK